MSNTPSASEYQYRQYTVKPEGHHQYLHPPVLGLLKKYVPSGSQLLDAGCGNGGLSRDLVADWTVCGFDLSESGIASAREQSPDARFEVGSVYDDITELFGQAFDAAVSLEVVEHLYDPHTYLRRIHDAVKPGSPIVISTPYHGYLKNVAVALTDKYDHHVNPLREGGHIKFWSRKSLSRLFDDCGFDTLEFVGVGRFPALWKSMILVGRRRA